MKSMAYAAAALVGIAGWSASWAQPAGHTMVLPADLKWEDMPSLPKGAKAAVIEGPLDQAVPFTVRAKLPANYRIPPHWHPAVERVTVLSGAVHLGFGDKFDRSKLTALGPGAVMIMQPKINHFAATETETVIQLHGMGPWGINYVNPSDDPRKK